MGNRYGECRTLSKRVCFDGQTTTTTSIVAVCAPFDGPDDAFLVLIQYNEVGRRLL